MLRYFSNSEQPEITSPKLTNANAQQQTSSKNTPSPNSNAKSNTATKPKPAVGDSDSDSDSGFLMMKDPKKHLRSDPKAVKKALRDSWVIIPGKKDVKAHLLKIEKVVEGFGGINWGDVGDAGI